MFDSMMEASDHLEQSIVESHRFQRHTQLISVKVLNEVEHIYKVLECGKARP